MTASQANTHPIGAPGHNLFDAHAVRGDFPALHQAVHGKPLVYLDNGATAHKPQVVIDTVREFYEKHNANVHRGVHALSERATAAYEGARDTIARYLNAAHRREIVLTRGTTEGINLVAQSYGRANLRAGDRVIISHFEHHSNIVPWQILCEQTGAELDVIPIDDDGDLDMDAYLAMLGPRTRVVAITHVANSLGTVVPIERIIETAHAVGAVVLVDGAQAVPHFDVDLQALDCDFYVFSAHKVFGPTGVGVLYGKAELLEAMPPWQSGGDMIRTVSFDGTTYADLPHRFEAGTPNIAGVIGFGAAIEYLSALDLESVGVHEDDVLAHATALLEDIDGVRIIGTAPAKTSVLSFVMKGVHAHDVGTIVDRHGVAIRTGHHCAMPVMKRFGVAATSRASFALYNTREDAEALAESIREVKKVFDR